MRQVIYISTGANVRMDEVEAILDSSRRNNPAAGITGFLLYNGRNFLQLLEGREDDLLALLAMLRADERHAGIVLLSDEFISQRDCPEWTMQHLRLSDSPDERRARIEADLPPSLGSMARQIVANFASLN